MTIIRKKGLIALIIIMLIASGFPVGSQSGHAAKNHSGSRGMVDIAAGGYHTMALKPDGSVTTWGSNFQGQTSIPASAQSGVVAIAAGIMHSLALKDDGTVVAWGDNTEGQTSMPTSTQSGVKAIAAGYQHSLALKIDGTVVAWGRDEMGQASVPSSAQSGVVAIAAGYQHSLALKADGTVVAWGSNLQGQTSIPTSAQSGVVAIAAGFYHSLAIKADGTVVAWGDDDKGQASVPSSAQSGVVAIAAGYEHSLALKADGTIVAWGDNSKGQTDIPTLAQSGVVAIAAGFEYSLALKADGTVVAWGADYYGETNVPAGLSTPVKGSRISAGYLYSLALNSDGNVVGWGHNASNKASIPAVKQGNVVGISAGDGHSLALKADGSVVAWGRASSGQITIPNEAKSNVVAIAAGGDHSLALKADGKVVAWGDDSYGQSSVPLEAQSDVAAIAAGQEHSLALKVDGSIVGWGANNYGQVSVPTEAQSDVVAIAGGSAHSMALKADGSVIVWGLNTNGQASVPAEAQSGVVAIAAGKYHSLALKASGSVIAWGQNLQGITNVPAAAQSGVVAIAAGLGVHSLALKVDGSIVGWGNNAFGESTVPNHADLSGISINTGTMQPSFDPSHTSYMHYVNTSATHVNVTATLADPAHAALYLNENSQTNGTAVNVPLTGDSTVIQVQVEPHWGPGKTYMVTVERDSTAPTVSFGTNGVETYSQTASTTVTISDSESGVDVDSLQYAWTQSASVPDSGEIWSSFANGDTLSISVGGGDWYLHIRAADRIGNLVNITTNRFRLDNTSPVVTTHLQKQDGSAYMDGSWTNQNVTASVYATDGLSGVAGLHYSIDGGSIWHPYTSPLVFTDEGTHTLMVQALDHAGHASAPLSRSVNISHTGLMLDVTMENADDTAYTSSSWTNQSVTASVYAYQTTSGVTISSTTYSLDDGVTWQPFTAPLSFHSEGMHTLQVKAVDSAGNAGMASQSIWIDQSLPAISFSANGNETYSTSASATVTVNDSLSDIDNESLQYVWTDSASAPDSEAVWTAFASGDTLSKNESVGDWFLHIQAKDMAGNTGYATTNRFRLHMPVYPPLNFGNNVELMDGNTVFRTFTDEKKVRADSTNVEEVSLDDLNQVLQEMETSRLTIRVYDTEQAVHVQLPADVIAEAAQSRPDLMIEVRLNGASYLLNVSALHLEQAADQLGIQLEGVKVHIILERADFTTEEHIRILAAEQGLQLAGNIMDFKITVQSNDGQSVEIKDFEGVYMERSIVMKSDTDDTNAIGVQYDPVTETLTFVPSRSVVQADGTKEMLISVPHNSIFTAVETEKKTFADLSNHWANKSVESLASKLIINGFAPNRFAPNADITRAEFTALLTRALGLALTTDVMPTLFSDVSSDAWYAPAVTMAVKAGWIHGYADGTFKPNQPIRREELAVLIDRARSFVNKGAEQADISRTLAPYLDQGDISDWAKQAVANLLRDGLIQGRSDDRMTPIAHTTRAEAAVMLNRLLKHVHFIQE